MQARDSIKFLSRSEYILNIQTHRKVILNSKCKSNVMLQQVDYLIDKAYLRIMFKVQISKIK